MNLILKSLATGTVAFFVLYLIGWYIGQEPNVAEWHPASRMTHTLITLFVVGIGVGVESKA